MATCVRIALGTPDDAGRLGADVWREAARELRERNEAPGSRESIAATACDSAAAAAEAGEDLHAGVPAYAGRTYRQAAPLRAAWLARVAVREALGPWGAS
jgi:hypothetical protein